MLLLPVTLVAFLLQLALDIESLSGAVRAALLVASYAVVGVALAVFVGLGRVPRLGTLLVGIGWALNCAAIAANGAMPVSASALEHAGRDPVLEEAGIVKHELISDDTRLSFLGDVIPIPPPGGVVLSLGDVVFLVGIAVFVAQAMRPLPAGRLRLSGGRDKAGVRS